ncbi:MAG: hypothetical protein LBC86_09545 [Oscillospiraceae bacterium]|jgi:hypothetical protein|nr:hypothetical protein [Oscillospiraceae bacterium]
MMKREYDLSKFFRNPERAKRLKENGCKVTITKGEGEDKRVVEQYFVTPEEVQAHDVHRKNHRVQN